MKAHNVVQIESPRQITPETLESTLEYALTRLKYYGEALSLEWLENLQEDVACLQGAQEKAIEDALEAAADSDQSMISDLEDERDVLKKKLADAVEELENCTKFVPENTPLADRIEDIIYDRPKKCSHGRRYGAK